MVKIGINALYLLPGRVGGSETYIRNLVKRLAGIDRENTYLLFVNRESEGVFEPLAPNVRLVPCPVHAGNRPLRILWEQFVLPLQLARHKVDILLSAGMTAPFACPATSVLILYDLQHINQPQNFSRWYLPFLRSIIYLSSKSADGIVTISAQARNDIERSYRIPPDRIAVTHLAVDHDLFHPGPADRALLDKHGIPERYVLYAASSLPHKNHERLLRAFVQVRDRVPGVKLVLIGARDKGRERVAGMITALGLDRDVVLRGWLPFEDVPAIYRASEAFVFPTLHEGFGLPVIEAMACGIPVICSKIEPLLEVAGDAALFVDPYSSDGIAAGVFEALSDGTMRNQLIQKGLARAKQFTWESTARTTLQFLKSTHAGRSR